MADPKTDINASVNVPEEDDESGGSGVEVEDTSGDQIEHPFNPALIRVETKPLIVAALLKRVENKEIDLQPEFQRKAGIWSEAAQSRLIESLLIRIPIPAFYVDASDDDRWLVVDGLQRLTTLKRFVLDQNLRLQGLEFLREQEGKKFKELPRNLQRRIEETSLTVYIIEKGTPAEVKYLIFRRINTGGLPLSPQEIRHALNPGPATSFLARLAASSAFTSATGGSIKSERMADREFCLRFLAFSMTPYSNYRTRDDLDTFLNSAMAKLNTTTDAERAALEARFSRAMSSCKTIFGRHAFRKQFVLNGWRHPINKALFETWSVSIDALSQPELELLIQRKKPLIEKFIRTMTIDLEFGESISQSTGSVRKVLKRFSTIEELIREVLSDPQTPPQ